MAIQGDKRERGTPLESVKKVGLFEGTVIAINPTAEELKEVVGIEVSEDSKMTEYLGVNKDGNTFLRVDVWMEEVNSKDKFKITFFLENKDRWNTDGTKKQYINNIGRCTWSDNPGNLPEWFTKRDYRVAKVGEGELYEFLRTWLTLDYSKESSVLELEWAKLMKGNVRELKEQVNGGYCASVVALATVSIKSKDGETREYQNVYNKGFLPSYYIKNFRLVNYSDPVVQTTLRNKDAKNLKPHERFVVNVTGEYGCRDYYILKDIQEYNSESNLAASDKVVTTDGSDY